MLFTPIGTIHSPLPDLSDVPIQRIGASLTVRPFLDDKPHGVFATRAPTRPNPIGLSLARLLRREGGVLWVSGIDVVDGTPLLDIKPYVPEFDACEATRIGWLDGKAALARGARSDDRFSR